MAQLTDQQRDTLVRTILGEARGEGVDGMAAVAHVIANRAASGQYPSDPARVARQPFQFSTWNTGEGGNNPQQFRKGSREYQTAAQVIDQVFGGQSRDPTNGALFYHTPQVNPNWSRDVNQFGTTRIGNHIFYNGNPVPPRDIPNAVASRLDVTPPQTRNVPLPQPRPATRPQIPATTPSQPTSLPSRAFPTNNVTPRLAPDMGTYQHNDRTMQPAQMVGGFGSLTPNATPSRAAPVRTAAPDPYRGIYPVQTQVRLPSLPPPSSAAPRPTLNQMRADTGQLRAT
ncbi:MAG TPA: cell wall hydrolase, partial [Acidovorax sp.]|nr:cell wall hydrolase [Acidovorax sp.]